MLGVVQVSTRDGDDTIAIQASTASCVENLFWDEEDEVEVEVEVKLDLDMYRPGDRVQSSIGKNGTIVSNVGSNSIVRWDSTGQCSTLQRHQIELAPREPFCFQRGDKVGVKTFIDEDFFDRATMSEYVGEVIACSIETDEHMPRFYSIEFANDEVRTFTFDDLILLEDKYHASEKLSFDVGVKVSKTGGDYAFDGEVRAAFHKRSGKDRYVVEDDRGCLHIFNAKQLARTK